MPSYLIAIAVGNLEYRSLGRRVGVITEPENIDLSADVLENLEELLDSVENYLGPYVWGNYTILVLSLLINLKFMLQLMKSLILGLEIS